MMTSKGLTERRTIRMERELLDAIERYAKANHSNTGQAVRTLIRSGWDKWMSATLENDEVKPSADGAI